MSAKVPSLEADSFFIKINCVAGAAYLSMPPADTCPPPTAVVCVCACVCDCVCVSVWLYVHLRVFAAVCVWACVRMCVPVLSNNGSVIRQSLQHMNESEGDSDQKSACYQGEPGVYTVNQNIGKQFCFLSSVFFTNERWVFFWSIHLVVYLSNFELSWKCICEQEIRSPLMEGAHSSIVTMEKSCIIKYMLSKVFFYIICSLKLLYVQYQAFLKKM